MAETTTKYSEAELVELLRQRSEPAFNYLYDNYSSALFTIISNIVKEEEQAADLLQEVFLKIWKQIGNYDASKGRLFTWMLNIARNASIDILRSKDFKNQQRNQELEESVYEAGGSVELKIDSIGLKKFISNLKPEQKQLIELSYFQGFTQEEISKMLELPLGTVKTRIRAALIQLRALIDING